MSLRGTTNNPYMPTMKSVVSVYTVPRGESLDASYSELFEEKTSEKLPQNGRAYSILTLRAFPNIRFAGTPEEVAQNWLQLEQDTEVKMMFGEDDIWVGYLEELLNYIRVPNGDGTFSVLRKEQHGVLLYSPEGEAMLQDMASRGEIETDKFSKIGEMITSKMVINPKSRFSVQLKMPEIKTDPAGATPKRMFIEANEYSIRFVLETDAFAKPKENE